MRAVDFMHQLLSCINAHIGFAGAGILQQLKKFIYRLQSTFGGLALANGGLGAVHGFAGPIGGMFDAPHGEVCASLLPSVMKANVEKIIQMDNMDALLDRYQEITVILTGNPEASIQDGMVWISE